MENKKKSDMEECVIKYKDNFYLRTKVGYKKIILTTDPDLINDGIQAIDDEFLEWFVKNPSCEEVEVKEIYNSYGETDIFDLVCTSHSFNYKIILPKEDPDYTALLQPVGTKQEIDMSKYIVGIDPYDKQETLEEAAERLYSDKLYPMYGSIRRDAFTNGAKWQAEKSYSEKEVIAFGEFIFKHSLLTHTKGVKSLFEQFKQEIR